MLNKYLNNERQRAKINKLYNDSWNKNEQCRKLKNLIGNTIWPISIVSKHIEGHCSALGQTSEYESSEKAGRLSDRSTLAAEHTAQ